MGGTPGDSDVTGMLGASSLEVKCVALGSHLGANLCSPVFLRMCVGKGFSALSYLRQERPIPWAPHCCGGQHPTRIAAWAVAQE